MSSPTAVQQAAYQRRSLSTMKAKVADMAAAWGDVDFYFEKRVAELADEIGRLEKELADYVAEGKAQ